MATVTVYTAARMKKIEDETVIGGSIDGDNLILETREGDLINAGDVRGPQGPQGVPGEVTLAQLNTVDNKAIQAGSDAAAAAALANSAMAIAADSKIVSRGTITTPDNNYTNHWLRMTNGIQIIWGRYIASSSLDFVQIGSVYTMVQPVFLLQPFLSGTIPTISVSEAWQGLFGATWGQVELPEFNAFKLRFWSPTPRGSGPLALSYFAIGYYKTPTA